MKSTFVKIGAVVLALLLLAYIGLNYFVGSLVRTEFNRRGPSLTQTKVTLDRARISPLSGNGTLSGLFVGNPKGWTSDRAFSISRIHVEIEPSSIFKDHIVINEIRIEKPYFVYETRLVSSNISDLLGKIQSHTGHGNNTKSKSGQPLKFEVRHLILKDGRVTLGVGPTALTFPMPEIDLKDLGRGDGMTSDQLALVIMRALSANVVQATVHMAGKVGSTMGAAAADAAKKAAGSLQSLLGK